MKKMPFYRYFPQEVNRRKITSMFSSYFAAQEIQTTMMIILEVISGRAILWDASGLGLLAGKLLVPLLCNDHYFYSSGHF